MTDTNLAQMSIEETFFHFFTHNPVEIPPPGREKAWKVFEAFYKKLHIENIPLSQRQLKFFKESDAVARRNIACGDLCSEIIDVIPASKNEYYGGSSFPQTINSLSEKSRIRPPLRYYKYKNVKLIFSRRGFSILDFDRNFDMISSRIPSSSDFEVSTNEVIPSGVITMDRFGVDNICHFLYDVIGRYIGFAHSGTLPPAPLLLPELNFGSYHKFFLEQLSCKPIYIRPGDVVNVKTLYVSDQVTVDFLEGYSHPACYGESSIMSGLKKLIPESCLKNHDNNKKIYISRKDTDRRKITNENELEKMLNSMGFASFIPGQLSPQEQLSLLFNANLVISPHGAGLTSILAANPQTVLLELINPMKATDAYYILSKSLGINYNHLLAECDIGDSSNVNLEKISDFVSGCGCEFNS